MNDLDRYITQRKDASLIFASDFDNGYEIFKLIFLSKSRAK